MGYPVAPVEMDRYGMDVAQLEKSGADVAYVMPAHQYPTGIVMPVRRRQELLAWACGGEGRYLIEDDYDSEFRYKGKPIPALQGMDTAALVFWCCRPLWWQFTGSGRDFTPPRCRGSIRIFCTSSSQKAIMSGI